VNFAIRVALLTTINGKANINTAVIHTNAGISQGALNIYYEYIAHIIYTILYRYVAYFGKYLN